MKRRSIIDTPADTKYLFLDIDGVLNSAYQHSRFEGDLHRVFFNSGDFVDINLCGLLSQFTSLYDIKVVLISAWATTQNLRQLKSFFRNFGFNIIGTTSGYCHGGREAKIYAYIEEHVKGSWAILDDSDEGTYTEKENRVVVHGRYGINYSHIEALEDILCGVPSWEPAKNNRIYA